MSKPDKPKDRAGSEEEAESRAYRRITSALERDDIDELAAALEQVPDPSWHAPDTCGGRAAERLIDSALAPAKQRLTLVRPSRDGRT